jgi:transposase-like protein
MQRPPDATPLELISISKAARKIGVNKSTLSRQIESGGSVPRWKNRAVSSP